MPALLYGIEGWGKIGKDEMNEKKKIQGRALKMISNLPKATSYIGLIMVHGQLKNVETMSKSRWKKQVEKK